MLLEKQCPELLLHLLDSLDEVFLESFYSFCMLADIAWTAKRSDFTGFRVFFYVAFGDGGRFSCSSGVTESHCSGFNDTFVVH